MGVREKNHPRKLRPITANAGLMPTMKRADFFRPYESLEIRICLLGEVYRTTPEKTTARLSLRYWWEDTCHHPGVPGQKKIRGGGTQRSRKETPRKW